MATGQSSSGYHSRLLHSRELSKLVEDDHLETLCKEASSTFWRSSQSFLPKRLQPGLGNHHKTPVILHLNEVYRGQEFVVRSFSPMWYPRFFIINEVDGFFRESLLREKVNL